MATNSAIISTALAYKGKLRYVFGGNNIADGYGDCSDFTEYIFMLNGLNIGGDTSAQYKNSKSVGLDNAKAGDLIFWKNTWNSGKIDGVSHVGIWLGDNKYIDLNDDGCNIHEFVESNNFLDIRRVNGVTFDNTIVDFVTETVDIPKNETPNNILRVVIISLSVILIIVFLSFSIWQISKEV